MVTEDFDLHPAEDALHDFNPDKDKIDRILFNGIVDNDNDFSLSRTGRRSGKRIGSYSEREIEVEIDDGEEFAGTDSDNDADSDHYNVGGKRGFHTNIDDFLRKFGSYVGSERAAQFHRSKMSRGPLILRTRSDLSS